MFIFQKRI